MKVAFVGMGRDPKTIPRGYLYNFVRYHLELPYYYSQHSEMEVTLTFPGFLDRDLEASSELHSFESYIDCKSMFLCSESEFSKESEYDVVIHWRKWFEHLYVPGAANVILSQDHSYGDEWLRGVRRAHHEGKLDGILVFPTWHEENTFKEIAHFFSGARGDFVAHCPVPLISGLTLGVDTSTYYPDATQDPFQLLWASDPGRGLDILIPIFLQLRAMDSRFQLNVTWPDYVQKSTFENYRWFLEKPGVNWIGQIPNDEKLHALFRRCGVLPYSSSFNEPSSRCHRQAMACGALVLYPPDRGTPSRLLEDYGNGIVMPFGNWARSMYNLVTSGGWKSYGKAAAAYAATEDWSVQAERFYRYFEGKTRDGKES